MPQRRLPVAEYVALALDAYGVRHVYELTGGMITFLLDAIARHGSPTIVSVHHEQAAAFMAEGEARTTGVPGVAMATSGPGATNLLTGIGSCYFDSTPAVFITGQVNRHERVVDTRMRQKGFQETDIVSMAQPVTKAAWRLDDPEEVPARLREAFEIALSGRPGPVLLDIPMDVQRAECTLDDEQLRLRLPGVLRPDPAPVAEALRLLAGCERPLILAGGGVRTGGATEALERFCDHTGIPVVTSLMGRDALPDTSRHKIGMIGTYGNRWANLAIGAADGILFLGTRLDVRQTGADVESFGRGKTLVQVDVDPAELGARLEPNVAVLADIGAFLEAAIAGLPEEWPELRAWYGELQETRVSNPDTGELVCENGVHPADLMHALSGRMHDACAYVVDVGANQMWAAQSLELEPGQRFLTSAGMGAMGFGLPAAVGAALASPGRPVALISGDGGIQVNIQELEVVSRLGLPVKILVVDNRSLGMVRQFQDELFDGRYQSTVIGYGAPDFVKVAEAYGIASRVVEEAEELDDALGWLARDPLNPACLVVRVSQLAVVCPKVKFGRPVFDMDDPRAGTEGA